MITLKRIFKLHQQMKHSKKCKTGQNRAIYSCKQKFHNISNKTHNNNFKHLKSIFIWLGPAVLITSPSMCKD